MSPITLTVFVCVAAAILEGVCAGKNVSSFFSDLQQPKYAIPLWAWSIIGGLYYVVFAFVLYRSFAMKDTSWLRLVVIVLVITMMILNGLSNWVIFRTRDLRRAFLIGAFFPIMDVALFLCLLQLDSKAALVLIPYLMYRVYGVYWGYAVWKANS